MEQPAILLPHKNKNSGWLTLTAFVMHDDNAHI